ncbi:MAG: molybdopterin-dependent oxidoreductase [Anaerolineaceae bacterium]|nr:molybdopterin-dependent oxidoreductase [Anaerolineaceae bacterium]
MKQVKTNCRLCGYLCALIAEVENGRVMTIEPDASRYPYDEKIVKGCRRCSSNLELLDHPDRINYPMKRMGARGSDHWVCISWEQALDEIADRLHDLKLSYGAETLATSIGGPHSVYWPLHRFLNLFGSPNNLGIGQICWNPAIWVNSLTFGWPLENELDPQITQAAIIWGMNPADSDNSLLWRTILDYSNQGGNLIVIDPRETRTARKATTWLPIKPASDAFLAMGLLHVLINHKLYDEKFVDKWCEGFDELVLKVQPYNPHMVAEITGITPDLIIQTAEVFAKATPATILTGRGLDQIGANSFPTHRAIACLRAITGNVDKQGAAHLATMPEFIPEIDFELNEMLSESQRRKQLGYKSIALQNHTGFDRVAQDTEKAGGRLPRRYLTSVHPNLLWQAILTEDPYPIRALITMGSNPLSSQADTKMIAEALNDLDLLVVLELTKTPTSILADYVLPIAGGLERPLLQTNAGTANIAYGGKAAVRPYYERRPDYDFWRGLGIRMGQEDYWPWKTFEESLDSSLTPLGITWDEFCVSGFYTRNPTYQKFTNTENGNNTPKGFSTSSSKIELYSKILEFLGVEPLPIPKPLLPKTEIFNLTLISGARIQPYYASAYRQVENLRKIHPVPLAEVGIETANKFRLKEEDIVCVETKTGKAFFKLKICNMVEGVVSIEYGWWFPGLNADEMIKGALISNANALTNADFEDCEPVLGQWQFNGLPCCLSAVAKEEAEYFELISSITINNEKFKEMEIS